MSAFDLVADDLSRLLQGSKFLVRINDDEVVLFVGDTGTSPMQEMVRVSEFSELATAARRDPLLTAALGVNAVFPTSPALTIECVTTDPTGDPVGVGSDPNFPEVELPLVECSCIDGCAGCWWTGQAAGFPLVLCGEGIHRVHWLDDSLEVEVTAVDGRDDMFTARLELEPSGLHWGAGAGLFNGDGDLRRLDLGVVASRRAAVDRARELLVGGLGFTPDSVTRDGCGRVVSATLYAHQVFPADRALSALLATAEDFGASVLLEPAGLGLDGSGWRVSFGLPDGGVVCLAEAWELSAALSLALRPDALDSGL